MNEIRAALAVALEAIEENPVDDPRVATLIKCAQDVMKQLQTVLEQLN